MRLATHIYRTIASISGQLILVRNVQQARIGEMVAIVAPDGERLTGEVLQISGRNVLVQLYGESRGLDTCSTKVEFTDAVNTVPLSPEVIGRLFSGSFRPIDGLPPFLPEEWAPINGFPMNPVVRAVPRQFIETGIAAIDVLNSLVRGQKLPIFSGAGLPTKELVAAILRHARLEESGAGFVVVFAALGLTFTDYAFYMETLRRTRSDFVGFINMADDPVMERLLAPRFALTVAEYLAFTRGMDVLVVITDITNYCDALREISNAREELPGRRGYPGYMYSDLASLFERAGRIQGRPGSVTIVPVLNMPEDDITHPIPDLTGYITEGQIVLHRGLHRRAIFPPVDVLPSLSRLMQKGIGAGQTRGDHRQLANLLYRHYARGRELKKLEAIIGRDGMSEQDRLILDFASAFEEEFIHQGEEARTIVESLDRGWTLLARFGLDGGHAPAAAAQDEGK
ncbi:MAG: V-type ATP synthase subunit B [Thermodesulfobacteriota bacterium]